MKEVLAWGTGFILWAMAIAFFLGIFSYGMANYQVSSAINRSMMLVQMRGGVDASIEDIVKSSLNNKKITVNSVSGSVPGRPYGDQVTLRIDATMDVLGITQPLGKEIKGTSIYRERK